MDSPSLLHFATSFKSAQSLPDTTVPPNSHVTSHDLLALFNGLPDYIFWKDRRSRYLGCNQRFAELVGLDKPLEIIGLSDYDLPWQVPGHRADVFQAGDRKVLAGEHFHHAETLALPNKPLLLMEVSKHPLKNAQGLVYGIIGVTRNKTGDKQLLAELEDHLHQLKEAEKSQQLLLDNVRHSLRTPLSGIIGLIDVLGEQPASDQPKMIDLIKTASQQLLYHVEQLIALASHRQGEMPIETAKDYPPAHVFEQLYTMMQPLADNKKIHFEIKGINQLPRHLHFTHHTFLGIAIHLVNNALQYTQKGSVTVSCEFVEPHLVLHVKDTGCGLSQAEQRTIQQPFTVVTPAYHRAKGGLGLGLSLVQQALQDQGGLLSIESTPNQGSCFTVHYPVSVATDIVNLNKIPDHQPAPPVPACKLLLVEDDEIATLVITHQFTGLGADVKAVGTAEQGLTDIYTQHFDLVVTDIGLPGLSGIELAKKVAELPTPPPMVALSAHMTKAKAADCLAAGMQAAYQKPLKTSEAAALIAQYSAPPQQTQRSADTLEQEKMA